MKKISGLLKIVITIIVMTLFFFFLMNWAGGYFLKEPSSSDRTEQVIQTEVIQELYLTALGDSLTQGVGDETQRGGYVSLTADRLKSTDKVRNVFVRNFGKSGATTDEIATRILEEKEIQDALAQASVVTVSAGGNDLIRSIRNSGFRSDTEGLRSDLEEYKASLENLFNQIRERNETAPIYIFGLYNPYEKDLEEVTFLQTLVYEWNLATKEKTESHKDIEFIPIDHLFRLEEHMTLGDETEGTNGTAHPYLYEDDYFHPNTEGYKMMASELSEAIMRRIEDAKGARAHGS